MFDLDTHTIIIRSSKMPKLPCWSYRYLYLKLFAIFLRTLCFFTIRGPMRRDRLLAEKKYGVRCSRLQIPSRDHGRSIAAHLYLPPRSSSSSKSKGKGKSMATMMPLLINYHGSGFVIDLLGTNVLFCAQMAAELGICVLDADYRKAPEHPFPAALHDVEDVLRWVATRGPRHGLDPTRVALSGFSAGGCLALAASSGHIHLRKKEEEDNDNETEKEKEEKGDNVPPKPIFINIRAVIGIYPVTDLAISSYEKTYFHPLEPVLLDFFADSYIPEKRDSSEDRNEEHGGYGVVVRSDPRISPGRADPDTFPATVAIVTCEDDILATEGLALARRLEDGSRKVVHTYLEGVGHMFDAGPEEGTLAWERREEMYTLVADTIREALELA